VLQNNVELDLLTFLEKCSLPILLFHFGLDYLLWPSSVISKSFFFLPVSAFLFADLYQVALANDVFPFSPVSFLPPYVGYQLCNDVLLYWGVKEVQTWVVLLNDVTSVDLHSPRQARLWGHCFSLLKCTSSCATFLAPDLETKTSRIDLKLNHHFDEIKAKQHSSQVELQN